MLRTSFSLTLLLGLGLSASAFADDDIRVMRQIPVNENITLPQNVKEKCSNIGLDLPSELSRRFKAVKLVKEAKALKGKGRYLEIEIIDVVAKQGSVFSGPKKMTVRGTLYENGKEVADFEGQRSSAVSSFSTCESLTNVEKKLGEDISKWLLNPKPGARL
jgi:hypothetical protein